MKLKIIMNPPYDKNLHLKITDKMTKDFPDAEIVSLSPIGWLQDPLAKDKKSDYNRFAELRSKIESVDEIPAASMRNAFSAAFHQDLGIYKIKNGGFDSDHYIRKYESFVSKIKSHNCHWEDKVESNKVDGIRVKTQRLWMSDSHGVVRPPMFHYAIMNPNFSSVFVDGKQNGKWWTEFGRKNKYTKNIGDPLVDSIKFDTLEEAVNFENFAKTKFMTFCNRVSKVGVNTDFSFLPFMPTYKHAWSDEDLYKFFNLTEDEISTIEQEMKE